MDKLKYSKLKRKAIALRKKGLSYNEIKEKIPVAKSTLSLWLKNIPLTKEQKGRLYTKNILILARGPNSQKERRIREIAEIIKNAEREIRLPLSPETHRMLGAALYWAEGSKTNDFSLTNSDPHLILFMVNWLKKVFNIHPEGLKVHLNIYPQQNEKEIKEFWSQLTNIPIGNFGKSFVKPENKGYKKNNLYYGTIKIKVPRGTDKRHQVFGWVKAALKDIAPEVTLTQRKWKSLQRVSRAVNIIN